jgi:hypothetical protein
VKLNRAGENEDRDALLIPLHAREKNFKETELGQQTETRVTQFEAGNMIRCERVIRRSQEKRDQGKTDRKMFGV